MRNVKDHLLACIGEECGEVQQIVGKSLRFGIFDQHPKKGTMNFEELGKELNDVIAAYEMLCAEVKEESAINRVSIENKKKRVLHYMKYAREVGQLNREGINDTQQEL